MVTNTGINTRTDPGCPPRPPGSVDSAADLVGVQFVQQVERKKTVVEKGAGVTILQWRNRARRVAQQNEAHRTTDSAGSSIGKSWIGYAGAI